MFGLFKGRIRSQRPEQVTSEWYFPCFFIDFRGWKSLRVVSIFCTQITGELDKARTSGWWREFLTKPPISTKKKKKAVIIKLFSS